MCPLMKCRFNPPPAAILDYREEYVESVSRCPGRGAGSSASCRALTPSLPRLVPSLIRLAAEVYNRNGFFVSLFFVFPDEHI